MLLNKKLTFLIISFTTTVFAQTERELDSINNASTNELNEVVITGQLEPQSIKKSVFNVRVI